MAEVTIGDRPVDTDVRVWDEPIRRTASLAVLGFAALLLVGAVVYYALDAAGSAWFLWTSIVVIVLLLVFQAFLLANDIARESGGPEWLAGPQAAGAAAATAGTTTTRDKRDSSLGGYASEEPEPEPALDDHDHRPTIELKCPECSEVFATEDDGSRPLETECPHCGAQGHVDLDQPPPTGHEHAHEHEPAEDTGGDTLGGLPDLDEEPEDEAEHVETLSLECPACDTQFDVEDDGNRPLETTCPGCGRSGKLKQ